MRHEVEAEIIFDERDHLLERVEVTLAKQPIGADAQVLRLVLDPQRTKLVDCAGGQGAASSRHARPGEGLDRQARAFTLASPPPW